MLKFIVVLVTFPYSKCKIKRIDGGPYYRPVPLAPRPPPAPAPAPGLFASLSNSFNSIVSNLFG